MAVRRRSLLEDDELHVREERETTSSGDVCESCGCTREKHAEDGCACGKCEEFVE